MLENINESLKPGNVFITNLGINPVRVIMSDGIAVFYEIWWSDSKEWSYKSSLKKSVIYYRTSVANFLKGATYFRTDPLTPEEIAVHRPELPLYLCRNNRLSWTTKTYKTLEDFERQNNDTLQFTVSSSNLAVDKIVLVPFGAKGGSKKGTIITPRDGKAFSCIELLWNAQVLEAPHLPADKEPGIGIYRQGFEKGIPSFYIGGFYDSAGFLEVTIQQ